MRGIGLLREGIKSKGRYCSQLQLMSIHFIEAVIPGTMWGEQRD